MTFPLCPPDLAFTLLGELPDNIKACTSKPKSRNEFNQPLSSWACLDTLSVSLSQGGFRNLKVNETNSKEAVATIWMFCLLQISC